MRYVDPTVIPANAGIHSSGACALGERRRAFEQWIPAFAGMTRAGARDDTGERGFSLHPVDERR